MRFSLTRTCPISTSHSHSNSSFIEVIPHVTISPSPTYHPQNTPFSSEPCANTQGTTTSTLHVSIPELTTSQPPSTEAKNANVQRGPMNDTLSCPGIALYAHERRRHHQSSRISMRFHISHSTSRTMIDTFISRLTLHQYPQHHMAGFWTIFFRNKFRAST
ncbi:uncharacterized protein EAF02_000302 [Botrytis sinoallii]|uniref:uncharacterized protein n=1 Tax=Botrytis sinoallii TaxID=1463999 RepID=UPI001901302D|nr:uncharacterized protein EAF02_000302 [Botrytis sinoallii]KAF7892764.1 hypothetical protein EAF02_000302 [Botrytis sinoallii]